MFILSIESIAQIAHEANRAYCAIIGDLTQLSWDDAPNWQKDSCIAGVEAILLDPSLTPEESHKSWFNHKLKDGWSWGPVKDPEKKEHPCMVSYDKLPPEQRIKDYLFQAVVRSLLPFLEPGEPIPSPAPFPPQES